MATIDSKGNMHGKVGNVVYRTVGNTAIVQSIPVKVKQSSATKESALEFGLASNCGRLLRDMYASFSCYSDGRLLNRMNAALLKCLKHSPLPRGERDLHNADCSFLEGLQFNIHSPLTTVLPVAPICSLENGMIKVHIPSFEKKDLHQPKYTYNCILRLMVAAVNFRAGNYQYVDYIDIALDQNTIIPAHNWASEVPLPANSLVLVTASVHCYGPKDINQESLSLNSLSYCPAQIIGAYPLNTQLQTNLSTATDTPNTTALQQNLNNYKGAYFLNEIDRIRNKNTKK